MLLVFCRFLVEEARALGFEVIDRCNLTVLLEPGQEDLASFLSKHRVHVVASLPCYSQKNVDNQRGAGVFERSIRGLQVELTFMQTQGILYLVINILVCGNNDHH